MPKSLQRHLGRGGKPRSVSFILTRQKLSSIDHGIFINDHHTKDTAPLYNLDFDFTHRKLLIRNCFDISTVLQNCQTCQRETLELRRPEAWGNAIMSRAMPTDDDGYCR